MDSIPAPVSGDQNRGLTLVIVIWVLTGLALSVVSIKIYTRIKILRDPALDDVFTVLAVVRYFKSMDCTSARFSCQTLRLTTRSYLDTGDDMHVNHHCECACRLGQALI